MLGSPHTSDFYFVRSQTQSFDDRPIRGGLEKFESVGDGVGDGVGVSETDGAEPSLETVQGRITTCSADKWGSSSGGSTPASRSATRAPRRHETSRLGRQTRSRGQVLLVTLPCPGRMRTDKASSASTCTAVAHPDILLLMLLWHARSVHHPDADAHLRPTEHRRPPTGPRRRTCERVHILPPLCTPFAPPLPPLCHPLSKILSKIHVMFGASARGERPGVCNRGCIGHTSVHGDCGSCA